MFFEFYFFFLGFNLAGACATTPESSTIETRVTVVVAFSNHLAALDDNTAVTIVKWQVHSLLKAEGEIGILTRRHSDNARKP
jgi:hypothetical protein